MIAKKTAQCGTCLFLQNDKVFESRCSELGRLPTSKACSEHKPCPQSLVSEQKHVKDVDVFGEIMRGMSPKRLDLMAEFIRQEKTTRRNGYKFGQTVYVRFAGQGNFLSNFLKGRVLMADNKHVFVIGESGKTYLKLINEKNSNTLFVVSRFRELRAGMVLQRKLIDPSLTRVKSDFTIPHLDEVPADMIRNRNIAEKNGKSSDNSLVALVAKMSSGIFDMKPEKKKRPAQSDSKVKNSTKKSSRKSSGDGIEFQY